MIEKLTLWSSLNRSLMKKMNAFLLVGLIGLVITAIIQFLRHDIQIDISFANSIQILYPIFIAVVIIGLGLMLKVESKPIDD